MKLEHWMQILIGGIILGTLGFLSTHVFDMKGNLSSVQTKVDATDSRISRIADALPELKTHIAWEETYDSIDGFVAVSNPEKQINEQWVTTTAVYDRDREELKFYSFTLDEEAKDSLSYIIAGKLKTENPYDSSFLEMVTYSNELKEPVTLPVSLNLNASFVFRSSVAEDMNKFIGSIMEEKPKTIKVGKIRNWKELTEKLDIVVNEAKELSER